MGRVFLACCNWCLQGDKTDGGIGASAAQLTLCLSVGHVHVLLSHTRETPCDLPELCGRRACVSVWTKMYPPTIVCGCLFIFVGGGQCRYQRFHVHDEVFMAQRVKTSTLTKLGSENTNINNID